MGEIPAVSIVITVLDIFDLSWNPTLGNIQEILSEPQYAKLDVKLHLVQGAVALNTGSPTTLAPNFFLTRRWV